MKTFTVFLCIIAAMYAMSALGPKWFAIGTMIAAGIAYVVARHSRQYNKYRLHRDYPREPEIR